MISIPREICVHFDQAVYKEWLVANGIGGYASSTVVGANTRRYHGLLVAALKPPVGRTVLLAKVDEDVEIDGRKYHLGCNEYPDGKIYPGGFVHIEQFTIHNNIPTTRYRLSDSLLEKTVWMERGHNTAYVRYTYLEGPGQCSFVLNPMCNYRDYHGITKGSFDRGYDVEAVESGCKVVAHEGAQPYWLTTYPPAQFTPTGVWYWNFVYRQEVARGYDDREDLYAPGVFRVTLQPGQTVTLVASTECPEDTAPLVDGAFEREQERQRKLLRSARINPGAEDEDAADPEAAGQAFVAQLVRAADTFIVARNVEVRKQLKSVPTIMAGYHWFTDWGRDTMISLPGLTFTTGRTNQADQVLRTFAYFVKDGLVPNNFPDENGPPHYNTVDGTLWMFAALGAIRSVGHGLSTARDLYPLLSNIIDWHVRGTMFGIGVDPDDGLLKEGQEGVQLTWMDAKVGDWVVTPRMGKPVEINALWYNALTVMAGLLNELDMQDKEGPDFEALAERARDSFRKRFWYAEGCYLYDVVDSPDGDDHSLRPNQLIALARPGLVPAEQARQALQVVRERLLTPHGLRTLDQNDPRYTGNYTGDRRERDAAYHNGTVWPWLLGPYFNAVRVIEGEDAARSEFRGMVPALRRHLGDSGLGTISEIFDADVPFAPKGCISQAWSVAEVLRLARELGV